MTTRLFSRCSKSFAISCAGAVKFAATARRTTLSGSGLQETNRQIAKNNHSVWTSDFLISPTDWPDLDWLGIPCPSDSPETRQDLSSLTRSKQIPEYS